MPAATRTIRPYHPDELLAVADLWHRTGLDAYPYLPTWQSLTRDEARRVFAEVIAARCELVVGARDDVLVAFLAMDGDCIERLYVDPTEQRRGWGTRFVALAKERSPAGLRLFTHQQNLAARALYEKLGFVAVRFGTSPPPESAPDVEYHWRAPA